MIQNLALGVIQNDAGFRLAARLEEVSTSGVEMLRKLNEQATRQSELEGELAGRHREIERLEAKLDELPDPEKAEKQTANLRQSVEQLLEWIEWFAVKIMPCFRE